MKRVLWLAALALLVVSAAPAWAANGAVRLSWDDCDPIVVNKEWAGVSSTAYTLWGSVLGSDVTNNGHRIRMRIGPAIPEAWRYDAGGCQDGQLGISHATITKLCPQFQGGNPFPLNNYSYDAGTQRALLDIANTYDDFTPVGTQRYMLFQANFKHPFSAPGEADPALFCRFAADPLCFWIFETQILVSGVIQPFTIENDWVTWSNAGNDFGGKPCPTVPANSSTWGRVKNLYR